MARSPRSPPRSGGETEIALADGTFRLRGIADRIERDAAGRCIILDYKTGSVRSEKQVRTGFAPQLTLEAAILRHGGFAGIPAGTSVSEIAYVKLKGGEPAGEYEPIKFKEGTPDSQADRALERLTRIAQAFDTDTEPYRSLVHPMWRTHYGDYDHLARVKEWSRSGGEIDDVGGGMRTPDAIPEDCAPAAASGRQSEGLIVARRQCRLGQNACARAARHQPAA